MKLLYHETCKERVIRVNKYHKKIQTNQQAHTETVLAMVWRNEKLLFTNEDAACKTLTHLQTPCAVSITIKVNSAVWQGVKNEIYWWESVFFLESTGDGLIDEYCLLSYKKALFHSGSPFNCKTIHKRIKIKEMSQDSKFGLRHNSLYLYSNYLFASSHSLKQLILIWLHTGTQKWGQRPLPLWNTITPLLSLILVIMIISLLLRLLCWLMYDLIPTIR